MPNTALMLLMSNGASSAIAKVTLLPGYEHPLVVLVSPMVLKQK
jgi:hypothetical protein